MKKNGSAVFLMELIIVILFFSVSSIVTLRLFFKAYTKERESAKLNEAIILAQNTVEKFRMEGYEMFGYGQWTERSSSGQNFVYTNGENNGLIIEITFEKENTYAGIYISGKTKIYTADEDSVELCSFDLAWYKSAAGGAVE